MKKIFDSSSFISEFTVPSPAGPAPESEPRETEDSPEIGEPQSVTVKKNGRLIHCLTVIGQIEGHGVLPSTVKTTKYEHMIPRIVAVEESADIDGLLLVLNTVGGDVEAGLALAELIAGMKKPTVSLVLGGGHSIGIPLAVSADYSLITPTATMTVHPVRMTGLVIGVPQTMNYFENIRERIVSFVAAHSSMPAQRFRELMLSDGNLLPDLGTVLDGRDAVKEGLIDEVGSLSSALEKLERMIE